VRGAAAGSDAPRPPVTADEFAALMARLGPFERAPRVAVAVSGGPDSLCLCLLADGWARARGGAALGLTVDHGLRPESAAEAALVAGWLAARGIGHATLPWTGAKPRTGVQAAARAARYRLLGERCRAEGVLHLLLAHHLEDQAETVLLRRAARSGPDGLAGMAAVREVEGLRLLRPLLAAPRARLRATLAALGQPWLDDPSNRDPAFGRARLRTGASAAGDDAAAALAEAARRYGLRRAEADREVAAVLARGARPHPAGFVELDRARLAGAEPGIARRALARTLCAVGGRAYPPRGARLEGLLRAVREGGGDGGGRPFAGRTLHGCRVLPRGGGGGERLLVCREPAAIREVARLEPGATALWDGRFRVRYVAGDAPLTVRALGAGGDAIARGLFPGSAAGAGPALPATVRQGLPSLWRLDRLAAVPHLGLTGGADGTGSMRVSLAFRPAVPLAGPTYAVNGVVTASG
jgi:tRNA(Ile)-lysidine synthase